MFFNADDDDDGFTASSSSNLANLFGSDKDVTKQSSLMYTAPKQPKRASTVTAASEAKVETKPSAGSSVVIYAGAVHAYKFDDGQPVHQGKLGAAIIGNNESCFYSLLLYRGKQQKVASASITLKFAFTVQDNNYASFYDDQRQSWSINFDNEQIAADFSKQVALAKVNSARNSLNSVLVQDLTLGHGRTIENGDTVHVKFTGWILSNYTFGNIFDSNENSDDSLKLKIGDGKFVKGFEIGIIGMKSGGYRIAIVPPSLGYGASGKELKIPSNATLIFTVRAKGEDSISSFPSSPVMTESDGKKSTRPTIPTKTMSLSSSEDISIKARSASITEQLHMSPKSDKARIISRMAKMGQQMLPFQGAVPVQPTSSESETEEEQRSIGISQSSSSPEPLPKPLPRSQAHLKAAPVTVHSSVYCDTSGPLPVASSGFSHSHGGMLPSQAISIFQPSHSAQAHVMPSGNPFVVLPSQSHVSSIANVDAHVPVLLSEIRTQNTELRLNVTQVAEKVDKVLGKLEQPSLYPTMEAGMLAHNIQRIVQENENLKVEIKEKDQKIVVLTEKITDLLQCNQKFLEKSNTMLEQRSDFLQSTSAHTQARLSSLEQDKAQLLVELSEAKSKTAELEIQLKNSFAKEQELMNKIILSDKAASDNEMLLSKYQSVEMTLNAVKQELTSTAEKLCSEQQENVKLKKSMQALESECEILKKKPTYVDESGLVMWKNKCDQLQQQSEELKVKLEELSDKQKISLEKTESSTSSTQNQNLIEEVKKIMNATYRNLQRQFHLEENYSGGQIRGILASTIRSVTLELLDYYTPAADVTQIELESNAKDKQVIESEKKSVSDVNVNTKNVEHQKIPSEFIQGQESNGSKMLKTEEKAESTEAEFGENSAPASADSDNKSGAWKPQPPPLFDVEDNSDTEDDWLK